ncbi:MAG: acyltransferase family protein [Candidatus Pacearchaeota archaeon]|jgi:hypothetical protein
MERRLDLDLLKGFAIIGVFLMHFIHGHFKFVHSYFFIWAVPLFIVATGAAYNNRLKEIRFKNIFFSFLWINLIILLTMLLCYILNVQSFPFYSPAKAGIYSVFTSQMYTSNYFMHNIWYIGIYFNILLFIFLVSKIERKFFKSKITLFVITVFCIYIAYNPIVINSNKILHDNLLIYIYLIWLGLYHYKEIKTFFNKSKTPLLLSYIALSSFLIYSIFWITNNLYGKDFILNEVMNINMYHPYIYIILMQLFYFIIVFSLIELLMRLNNKYLIKIFSFLGIHSLYLYIFHQMLFFIIYFKFFDQFSTISAGLLTLLVIIPFIIFIGYFLNIYHEKLKHKFININSPYKNYSDRKKRKNSNIANNNSNRRLDLDLLKGFGIIGVLMLHFGSYQFNLIPKIYSIAAVPLFIFITAAAYNKRLQEIRLKKILFNFLWINFLLIFIMFLCYSFNVPLDNNHLNNENRQYKQFFHVFYFINPYISGIWYLYVYFGLLIFLFILSKIEKNYFKNKSFLAIITLFCIGISHLSYNNSKFLSEKIDFYLGPHHLFIFLYLVFLGLYHYHEIKDFFNKQKTSIIFLILFSASSLFHFSYKLYEYYFGKDSLLYIQIPNTIYLPFIMAIFYQLLFFIIVLSLVELILRSKSNLLSKPIYFLGGYSLYIFILHSIFFFNILRLFPSNYSFNLSSALALIIALVSIFIISVYLDKLTQYLQKKFMDFDFSFDLKKRRLDLDLLKTFGIIGFLLFIFIPSLKDYLVWILPVFILAFSAGYSNLKELKVKEIILNISWILFFILITYFIFSAINTPTISPNNDLSKTSINNNFLSNFIFNNPYLGNIEYIYTFFIVIIFILIIKRTEQDFFKDKSILLIIFLFSISFLYLISNFNNNFYFFKPLSWLFLVWFSIYHYDNMILFFNKLKIKQLILIITLSFIYLFFVYILSSYILNKLNINFIFNLTEPYILTILLLLGYFPIIFSVISLINILYTKSNKSSKIVYDSKKSNISINSILIFLIFPLISIISRYSIYIYLLNMFIFNMMSNFFKAPAIAFFILFISITFGFILDIIYNHLKKSI